MFVEKFLTGPLRISHDPVAIYLEARGVSAKELPPDMLRELTRLMENGQLGAIGNSEQDHRHDLLTFEMYLAAWIASERVCDRPKDR